MFGYKRNKWLRRNGNGFFKWHFRKSGCNTTIQSKCIGFCFLKTSYIRFGERKKRYKDMVLIFLKPDATKTEWMNCTQFNICHFFFKWMPCMVTVTSAIAAASAKNNVYGCAKPVFALLLSFNSNDFEHETE